MPAARAVVALAALALLVVAFAAHPLGDHFTESDFYEYAAGGRGIARGSVDFSRYGVIGPVYEFLLAIPAWLFIPAFTFARLLSVASITTMLVAWLAIVRRMLGGRAALVTVALLAANPVLFRYGYSSTTDAPALAFQSVAVAALLLGRGRIAPWVAGASAALAVLTRYSSAYLLPAAIAQLLWLGAEPRPARRAALVRWLAAFTIVAAPWTALSVAHGHWPGEALFSNATFYASSSAQERNVQDRPGGRPAPGPPVPTAAPAESRGLVARVVANAPAHLAGDARDVLGWPTAALCALGIVMLASERRMRAWQPLALHGGLAFLALAPVFYSDRYSLAVLPYYLSVAGVAVASPGLASLAGRARPLVPAALLAWPLAASLAASVRLQRFVHSQLPLDVPAAAKVVRGEARPGDGLISRKGAVAFYGGVRPVWFPRVASLAALAAHARANRARFLYFSWYEGMLRPEFWYLLDTTTVIPGLTRIASVLQPAAVLYRIEPGFGVDPAWMADPTEPYVHVAQGEIRALDDPDAWEAHAYLARRARLAGRWDEALVHYQAMARGRPKETSDWVYLGDALVALGRLDEARAAYGRALAISPRSLGGLLGLGWISYADHRWAEAAAAWRPLIAAAANDPRTLDAMIDAFTRAGDTASAEHARRLRAGAPAPR